MHHMTGGDCYDYDLIVIGGGSGGLACSKEGSVMIYVHVPAVLSMMQFHLSLVLCFGTHSCLIWEESGRVGLRGTLSTRYMCMQYRHAPH